MFQKSIHDSPVVQRTNYSNRDCCVNPYINSVPAQYCIDNDLPPCYCRLPVYLCAQPYWECTQMRFSVVVTCYSSADASPTSSSRWNQSPSTRRLTTVSLSGNGAQTQDAAYAAAYAARCSEANWSEHRTFWPKTFGNVALGITQW